MTTTATPTQTRVYSVPVGLQVVADTPGDAEDIISRIIEQGPVRITTKDGAIATVLWANWGPEDTQREAFDQTPDGPVTTDLLPDPS